jgi:hypothetical protein
MAVPAHMAENDASSPWRASPRQATHGSRKTLHDVNRHIMVKWSAVKQAFLLSPQQSVLVFPGNHHVESVD